MLSLLSAMFSRSVGPVIVSDLDRAGEAARASRSKLVISISDPERRERTRDLLTPGSWKTCELDFHDIEREAPDLIAPAETHIQQLLSAIDSVRSSSPIVVHCHAGISRSSAAALLGATHRRRRAGIDDELAIEGAIKEVLVSAPHARPNMSMIELGGNLMGLGTTSLSERAWRLHCR